MPSATLVTIATRLAKRLVDPCIRPPSHALARRPARVLTCMPGSNLLHPERRRTQAKRR